MKGMIIDDHNMSNLTCASNQEIGGSSTNTNMYPQQPKKKRNLPGNPDPEAEVVALSPRTLMTTNRFTCEICNKGFQRDQNLQLHRRGHNLPWKLKQRTNKDEVMVKKKKVYVCPEASCIHHEASRALGDLTGVKKHFYRKHGEKKWSCEKCSKRYAVHSDWKAHSKICGTREYRCDCGTLFTRRDSFITHRAYCDALAEEGSRATSITTPIQTQSHNLNNIINNIFQSPFPMKKEHNSTNDDDHQNQNQNQNQNQMMMMSNFNPRAQDHHPSWLSSPADHHHHQVPFSFSHTTSRLHQTSIPQQEQEHPNPNNNKLKLPHMSATALVQKAAQMGVTVSSSSEGMQRVVVPHQAHDMAGTTKTTTTTTPLMASSSTVVSDMGLSSNEDGGQFLSMDDHMMMMMMGSLSSTSSSFEDAFNGILNPRLDNSNGGDGLTRDFLGIRPFPNMGGLNHITSSSPSSHHHQQQNHTSWGKGN